MRMRQNPMCFVFPRIVSCNYHRFGTGGREENLNSICILSLNIINEKVFLGKLLSYHKPYPNIKEFYMLKKITMLLLPFPTIRKPQVFYCHSLNIVICSAMVVVFVSHIAWNLSNSFSIDSSQFIPCPVFDAGHKNA